MTTGAQMVRVGVLALLAIAPLAHVHSAASTAYGAVAIDYEAEVWALRHYQSTQSEADRKAVDSCNHSASRYGGSARCQVRHRFGPKECASVFVSATPHAFAIGVGVAKSASEAMDSAEHWCNHYGGSSAYCKYEVTECNKSYTTFD